MSGTTTAARIARKARPEPITHPIRTKKEFNEVREEWLSIMDAPRGTPERDRFELLTILIAAYENQYIPEPDLPSPQAAVRFMAEQKGLTATQLANLLGGAGIQRWIPAGPQYVATSYSFGRFGADDRAIVVRLPLRRLARPLASAGAIHRLARANGDLGTGPGQVGS